MKTILFKIFSVLVIALISFGCSKEVPLENAFEPKVLVYGNINTELVESYVSVTIRETVPVTSKEVKTISTAKLKLYSKDINEITSLVTDEFVFDTSAKRYDTREKIRPITGNSYWLEIELSDGTILESIPEKVAPSVEIVDITKEDNKTKVTFKDPLEKGDFYVIFFYLTGQNGSILSSQRNITNDELFENGLGFSVIDNSGQTAEVRVMNVDFYTYKFMKNVEAQNSALATDGDNPFSQFFATPPTNLEGNIINKQTGERALGFFGIFNSTTKTKNF
ncbi:conserved protein of unknown function [Tenacibaculum sp. 190524A02b]|uniref:DUF4249 family protein n=1 Tax=Tenacibaculum vairaonense TaxID=3137860 RepID=UPI0032B298C1